MRAGGREGGRRGWGCGQAQRASRAAPAARAAGCLGRAGSSREWKESGEDGGRTLRRPPRECKSGGRPPWAGRGAAKHGCLEMSQGRRGAGQGILSWGREKRSGLSRSRLSTFCCCIKKCLGVLGVYGAQDRARPTAHAPTLGRPLPAHYRLTPRQPPPRPSPPPPKPNLALRAAWGMVADAARHAGAAADAVPGARALVPWWRRATRWRQTSDAEGRAAEAGLIALSRCAAARGGGARARRLAWAGAVVAAAWGGLRGCWSPCGC